MASNKLKLSKLATKELEHLSARLALRPNIICRLAVGRSLVVPESIKEYERTPEEEEEAAEYVEKEFNRFTLTGEEDELYKILIYQHEYEASANKIPEGRYYFHYFRLHIERGLDLLYYEYQRVNSPVEFLKGLTESIDGNGKISRQSSMKEYKE